MSFESSRWGQRGPRRACEGRGGHTVEEARVGDTSGPTGFASNPRFIDREVPGEPNGRPCVRPALLKQNLYRHFMRLIYAARVKPTKMDGTNDSEVEARGEAARKRRR